MKPDREGRQYGGANEPVTALGSWASVVLGVSGRRKLTSELSHWRQPRYLSSSPVIIVVDCFLGHHCSELLAWADWAQQKKIPAAKKHRCLFTVGGQELVQHLLLCLRMSIYLSVLFIVRGISTTYFLL